MTDAKTMLPLADLARDAPPSDTRQPDPFSLRHRFEPLRVVDVCDALDGIGYANLGNISPEIRPLWAGVQFWGVAFTVRGVPANRPMWNLDTTEEVVNAHNIWFRKVGLGSWRFYDQLQPGHVVVTDTGGAGPVGLWGSENTLRAMHKGVIGIVTNGQCRDSAEIIGQRTPICAAGVARTIIPGRIEIIETQSRIGCGGVQVRPGDIVGCDADGIVVVPLEVAEIVATHARAVLLHDVRTRRDHYQQLGIPGDASTDIDGLEARFAAIDVADT